MKLDRSEQFDIDVERQYRWYLAQAGLDPVDGQQLEGRFADVVEATLEFLSGHPEGGRRRFAKTGGFEAVRSWAGVNLSRVS